MIRATLAVVLLLGALLTGATPASASQVTPVDGAWHGSGMTFEITADEHGARHVTGLRFHHFTFPPTLVHRGNFFTCVHAGPDRLCLHGHFHGHDVVTGTGDIQQGVFPPLPIRPWSARPVG